MTLPSQNSKPHVGHIDTPVHLGFFDARTGETFDRLTHLTTASLGAPMALISLVEAERQIIKSCSGLPEPWASRRHVPLTSAFCRQVVNAGEILLIPDIRSHPKPAPDGSVIQQLGVVAYAGVPLVTASKRRIGTLCVLDTSPRVWTSADAALLAELASTAVRELNLCAVVHHQESLLGSTGEGIFCVDLNGRCTFINRAASAMLGYRWDEIAGENMHELSHHHYPDGRVYPQGECRIFHAFREAEGIRITDEVLWRRDGSSFPVKYSSFPITENGYVTGAIIAFSDITDRKLTEARLRLAADAGTVLTGSFDIEGGLQQLAQALGTQLCRLVLDRCH